MEDNIAEINSESDIKIKPKYTFKDYAAQGIAIIVKTVTIYFLFMYGLHMYDPKLSFWSQKNPFIMWFLYLPAFMGYERMISSLIRRFSKTKN